MQEKNMRFGDYIKKKRMDDPREVTLSDMSKQLGISISFLSDIENKRRSPFGADKIEKFAAYLELSDGDKAFTYDLASRERREIPSDIEDVFMYEEIGNLARFALRESNAGNVTEEDWKRFIREIQERKEKRND